MNSTQATHKKHTSTHIQFPPIITVKIRNDLYYVNHLKLIQNGNLKTQ